MKSRVIKKRKSINWKKLNIFSSLTKKVQLKQTIDGENLIEEPSSKPIIKVVMIVFVTIGSFLFIWAAVRFILSFIYMLKTFGIEIFTGVVSPWLIFENAFNFQMIKLPALLIIMLIPFSVVVGVISSKRISYSFKTVIYGQKGDSRLTTIKEIGQQYIKIPDKTKSFKGFGGIPISHYKDSYFIDTDTVHNIIVGTSRSGKGQTEVLPMIDILSRAEQKSSMVINDPKGELYNASYNTLKKRGYDVYLLNLADGSQSMSYNPLSLIVKAWLQGDTEGGMQLVNTLTYTLYHDDQAGQNAWAYEAAQKAVNGMIIALIEYCVEHNMIEKITLNNVIDMLNVLGSVEYAKDPEIAFDKTNLLDEFFKSLPQSNIAQREFSTTNFSGSKAKGSIFATIIQKLSVFSMPKMARLTSMNTLDFKTVGFPKYISFQMDKSFRDKRIDLIFISKDGDVRNSYKVKVGFGGFVEYNFDDKLLTGDKIIIRYIDEQTDKRVSSSFEIDMTKENPQHIFDLIPITDKLGLKNIKFVYSLKPVAIFMKIPDYDNSNNALASIFVSQLYGELAKQCSFVAGAKTTTRVHFLLDEFGNMIPIKDMDQIMTVSAGRNILFSLFLQSYAQLFNRYGKEAGQTIKENGQNQILIKTIDRETVSDFSEGAGKKTIENANSNRSMLNINQSMNVNADSMPLLTQERLISMLEGEMLVLRPLHRHDLKHKRVRPYPIFNTKKTLMPYAYTFLGQDFNTGNDPNMLDIYSPHADLDLKSLSVDFRDFVKFDAMAIAAYDQAMNQKKVTSTGNEINQNFEDNNFKSLESTFSDKSRKSAKSRQSDRSTEISSPTLRSIDTDNLSIINEFDDNDNPSEFISLVKKLIYNKTVSRTQGQNILDSYKNMGRQEIINSIQEVKDLSARNMLIKIYTNE